MRSTRSIVGARHPRNFMLATKLTDAVPLQQTGLKAKSLMIQMQPDLI
ncbi:hypothetical protein [Microseira wollei]|nr:hypothetical protein [Microseira wollei]